MSSVDIALAKVKRLDEVQAEALLDWLALRENKDALRQRLDSEIGLGIGQLRRDEKHSGEEVHREIRERSRARRQDSNGEFFYSAAAREDLFEIWEFIARDNLDAADRIERESRTLSNISRNTRMLVTADRICHRSRFDSGGCIRI